jgi:hypothetical protein
VGSLLDGDGSGQMVSGEKAKRGTGTKPGKTLINTFNMYFEYVMVMGKVIPVDKGTRDRVQKLTAEYGVTYAELLNELLDTVDTDDLDLERTSNNRNTGGTPSRREDEHVRELLNKHSADDEVIDKVMELVDYAYSNGDLLRNTPRSIAAGGEYLARKLLNQKCTQKEIASKYDVTPLTLRKAYKQMEKAIRF